MHLFKGWPIKVAAVAVGVSVFVFVTTHLNRPSFRLAEVKPAPVVETKLSGEQTIYQTIHAAVAGYPDATEADMYAYADKIFSDQLRDMAERDAKSQIWITFYLERVVINGQEKIRTFRIIFAQESTGWRRLEPKTI